MRARDGLHPQNARQTSRAVKQYVQEMQQDQAVAPATCGDGCSALHADQRRAPGQAAAQRLHQHQVAALDAAVAGTPRPAPAGSRRPRCWRGGPPSPPPAPAAGRACLPIASMMRRLAWCGTSQSHVARRSAHWPPAPRPTASASLVDGVAEHLAAVHDQVARPVGPADRAVDIQDVAESALGVQMGGQDARARRCRSPGPARRNTAPAPSPNSTQVPRSCQFRMRE